MTRADKKKLENIAEGFTDSFPALFRRVSRGAPHPSAKKFDPSKFVLKVVQVHGTVRMSEIGRHMGISRPYMTALVDKLIREGLVERVSDPHDRRVVNVRTTPAGRKAIKDFENRTREVVLKNLSSLDPEDISTLHEMVLNIKDIVHKMDMKEKSKCKSGKGA